MTKKEFSEIKKKIIKDFELEKTSDVLYEYKMSTYWGDELYIDFDGSRNDKIVFMQFKNPEKTIKESTCFGNRPAYWTGKDNFFGDNIRNCLYNALNMYKNNQIPF